VTSAAPAEAVADADAVPGAVVALELDAAAELAAPVVSLDDSPSLEQPAAPTTTIVAAPTANNNSRFTEVSLIRDRRHLGGSNRAVRGPAVVNIHRPNGITGPSEQKLMIGTEKLSKR
jgi:hypothetical protein